MMPHKGLQLGGANAVISLLLHSTGREGMPEEVFAS